MPQKNHEKIGEKEKGKERREGDEEGMEEKRKGFCGAKEKVPFHSQYKPFARPLRNSYITARAGLYTYHPS